MTNFRVVSDNQEPVQKAPTWSLILEVNSTVCIRHIVTGYPSFSGPMLTFFSSEDENGTPIYMCPYHRVISNKIYDPSEDQVPAENSSFNLAEATTTLAN